MCKGWSIFLIFIFYRQMKLFLHFHHTMVKEVIMNVILTGGGTAGHVIPNIALLPELKKRFDNVYYAGSSGGVEERLAGLHGIPFFSVETVKFHRKSLLKNLALPKKLFKGVREAEALIKSLRPSVIFSKGGYVGLPLVIAGGRMGVPVVLHESDYTLGLANRIGKRYCSALLTAFPETAKKEGGRAVGIPLREELFKTRKKAPRAKEVLLITGGSSGASSMNEFFFKIADKLTKRYEVIHLTGRGKSNPALDLPGYTQIEYSDDMASLYAKSSVVISRAGATTVFELSALGKKALLIPLPKRASRGDQILNARAFSAQGRATFIEEKDLNIDNFFEKLSKAESLVLSPSTYASNSEVASIILSYAKPFK